MTSLLHVRESQRGEGVNTTINDLPKLLAATPHRLMFFAGATAVILSMLWWACVLANSYFGWSHLPPPPVPAGWAHAVFTQYGMLPLFIFGFLLTVFPRWMPQPALGKRHYVPVFIGLFGGYLLSHAGLVLGSLTVLLCGLGLMLLGWLTGLVTLGRVLMRHAGFDPHAVSCFIALVLGACGLCTFTAFAGGASWQIAWAAIKIGTFGLLLPIFFTVCHRMIPFFSAAVVHGYRVVRPRWSLPLLWLLLWTHLTFELSHRYQWLWVADAPLAIFFMWHWIAWQPWKCMKPSLLAALHLAVAWLPIAMALYTAQSLFYLLNDEYVLGRAPVHALTIGFFGSMMVAMVTRVTQGHSGRPLEMGRIPWLCFGLLQVVVLLRMHAESAANSGLWLLITAVGWLIAFLPWVARALWIYLTPRVDGKPG